MGLFVCNECALGEKSKGVSGKYLYVDDKTTRDIMIISDCPHDSDSFVGTYFANKHANNFIKLLQDTRYNMHDIYVTALVKCTPFLFTPDPNRPINKETLLKKASITACSARLIEEITTIEPKYLILFGEKVFSYFFPDLSFSDNRGKILHHDDYNVDVIATYNPISMAYTNKFDRIIKTDMDTMSTRIYGAPEGQAGSGPVQKDYRFPLKDLSLLEALNKRLKEVETFAVDIETHGTGLFKYKLLSIGFSYKEHTGVSVPVWVRDENKVSQLEDVLNYQVPTRHKEEVVGTLKNGKPKIKRTSYKQFLAEDRALIKELLPAEYAYLVDLPTLRDIKQQIRGILDKEPPLKKYWGDQHDHCMALIKEIMENDTPKGFHNGGYDVNRLRGIGINVKNYAWDTILMHHLLDEERSHKLDDLSFVYTKDGGYKSGKNVYLKSENTSWANIPMNVLLPYNAQDADVTLQLYHIFKPELQKQGKLWNLFKTHVMPAQRILLDMSFRGSNVDLDWLNKTQEEYQKQMKDLVLDFQDLLRMQMPGVYVVSKKEEETLYKQECAESGSGPVQEVINLNSTAHMVHVFRDIYGIKDLKKTATGESLDANTLKRIAKKNKLADILLKYKVLSKLDSTYLTGIKDGIDADGKIHGEFLVYGTTSGRLSSKAPNLQNIPGDMKTMFVPPPGYICVNVDQSAAELHVAAWMSMDKVMISAFEQKKDLHNFTACGIFNKKPEEITHDERQIGKKINFMSCYAVSGPGLAEQLRNEGIKITDNQADKYLEKWRAHYRGVARYLENAVKLYKYRGYLETPFGRRRRKYKIFSDRAKEESMARSAQNFTIQSTASDIQISEMVEMYNVLIEHDVWPVFTVHDSITMWVRPENLEWLRGYYKQMTCRRFTNEQLPGMNNCLMVTEMEVGRNYGEHIKLPYDCDFQKWKEENKILFDTDPKS